MFTETESKLLHVTCKTFQSRKYVFDFLSDPKWKDTGIENWVQIELMAALIAEGLTVSTIGKKKLNCDLIMKDEKRQCNVGIELETITYPQYYNYIFIKQGLEKHVNPEPDMFLFLGRLDEKALTELEKYLKQHNYEEKHQTLFNDWMVMIAKRNG